MVQEIHVYIPLNFIRNIPDHMIIRVPSHDRAVNYIYQSNYTRNRIYNDHYSSNRFSLQNTGICIAILSLAKPTPIYIMNQIFNCYIHEEHLL